MEENEIIEELEDALDKAKKGFVKMSEAKVLLGEADMDISISALKCDVMAEKGNTKFIELMEMADNMRRIVRETLKRWPLIEK